MSQFLASGLFVLAAITVAVAEDTPPFKITTKRNNDRVEVKTEKDQTVFSIHSPIGIGNAIIERSGEKWPDALVLRFHLKGLENFSVTNGKLKVQGSVSSQDGKVRLWKDGKEDSPLDANSPCWLEFRMVGGDGKPTKAIPLRDGYLETVLPRAFFENNPKSITVAWIDFYRN